MNEYKYQKQERFNWCTIACMSMIYESYGIIKSQDSIYYDMVKTQSIDNNGWVPLGSAVSHINKNSFLSVCLIKVTNPDYLFDFVTDNNISMIMSHRARFSDGHHSTLFERKENDLIYGIDPENQDLFPIKKDGLKELWKDNWYLKTEGNAILVSNNNDIFSESTATCGHTFKVINIPEEIAEFISCPLCNTWRRINKMSLPCQ